MTTKEFKERVFSLTDRIYPMVARMLGNRANAEDAMQEIMIKLWDKRKQIDQHPNLTGFVILTARNYCFDVLKKKRIELAESAFQLSLVASESGQDALENEELRKLIELILQELPEQQREVMIMRDLDGLEFIEIAEALQLNIEHVRVLVSRARKKVGIELKRTYSYGQG